MCSIAKHNAHHWIIHMRCETNLSQNLTNAISRKSSHQVYYTSPSAANENEHIAKHKTNAK